MFDFTDELCVLHENDKYSTVTAQEYQEYYDKGLPIWTREFFENLDRELQEHPERIAVKDVDGSVIVFISKPDTENIIEKETKFTVRSKALLSQSVETLTNANPRPGADARLEDQPGPPFRIFTGFQNLPKPLKKLEDLKSDHEKYMEGWLESDTRDKLEDHIRTTSLPIIRKIVCFGLGSFSLDYKRDTAIHIQHAAIATMAEALQQKEGTAIKCFVQDPAYTDADKELLRELGLTVLADPKGFLEIDKDTLVFDCGCLYALDDIVADLCRPAALCWDTVHSSLEEKVEACMQWADGHNTVETDENGVSWAKWEFTHSDGTKEEDRSRTTNFVPSRVRDSMDQYHGWQLPYDENFDGLTFYVRKHE